MKPLVVYGGRFQPPHKGHLASYNQLASKFGKGNVYMASADKELGSKDPFTWDEKKSLAVNMGVPSDHFIKVSNVYSLDAIKDKLPFNEDDTVVILALSKKDADRLVGKTKDKEGYALKKDGSRAAIQHFRKDMKPASSGHMYAFVTDTETFPVAGEDVTGATQIRELYKNANDKTRVKILQDLYGKKANPKVKQIFDKRLSAMHTESILREYVEFLNSL